MSHVPTEEEIENEIINLAPGEGVKPLKILTDSYCEEFAFPHLFPTGKFGYSVLTNIFLIIHRNLLQIQTIYFLHTV